MQLPFLEKRHRDIHNEQKTLFDWTLDDIRIEKIISAPIWACQALIWVTKHFLEISALHVTHCPKLLSCAISRKTNDANLRKCPTFFS